MKKSQRQFLLRLLVTAIAIPGPVFSAQGDDSEKRSIIRVISNADGFEGVTHVGEGNPSSITRVSSIPFKRGYLGVQLVDLTPELRAHFGVPEDSGVMIAQVVDDSPAAAAGFAVGDILTALEGDRLSNGSEVARKVSEYEEGDTISIEVWRDRKVRTLTATVAERERTAVDLGRFVLPGGGRIEKRIVIEPGHLPQHILEIDESGLHEALRDLELRFENPDFLNKFKMLGRDREDLQARIQELEERLKVLEKQLDKLPNN